MSVIMLLVNIRLKLMSRFQDKFTKVVSWETKTTPYIRKLLC
jgi:hypothetical protein